MTKEFIIKSLLPYKENPDLCGYNGKNCVYLTEDNKKCAIGQYMKPGPWQNIQGSVTTLFHEHEEIDIMTDEWLKQNVTEAAANAMQEYHDSIAKGYEIHFAVGKLEQYTGFNLNELK